MLPLVSFPFPVVFNQGVERNWGDRGGLKNFLQMPTSIITTDDLREFKLELIEELRILISKTSANQTKKYLKSAEVMELLQISPGTLQNLRINGTLPYSKIGGIILYDAEEIQRILNENRIDNSF